MESRVLPRGPRWPPPPAPPAASEGVSAPSEASAAQASAPLEPWVPGSPKETVGEGGTPATTKHGLRRRPRPREGEGWAWLCQLPSAWGGRRARLTTAFPWPQDTWALFGARVELGAAAGRAASPPTVGGCPEAGATHQADATETRRLVQWELAAWTPRPESRPPRCSQGSVGPRARPGAGVGSAPAWPGTVAAGCRAAAPGCGSPLTAGWSQPVCPGHHPCPAWAEAAQRGGGAWVGLG